MQKKLMLEYSIEEISDFQVSPSLAVENTLRAHEEIQEQFPDIEFSLLPYARIKSMFTGGRHPKFSQERVVGIAQALNEAQIRCMLVLNGGLLLPKGIDLSWEDPKMADIKETLDSFAGSEVDNAVTIYHDSLLDVIDERYPDLKKIASCIRFVGGKKGEFQTEPGNDEYDRTFADKRFSQVVPLNQHTTYDFLKRFEGDSDRITAFLKLHCGADDIYSCYAHYCGTEKGQFGVNSEDMLARKDFVSIKSQTEETLYNPCRGGYLSARSHDLQGLIKMGVNKYKLPSESISGRTTSFRIPEIGTLLNEILLHGKSCDLVPEKPINAEVVRQRELTLDLAVEGLRI